MSAYSWNKTRVRKGDRYGTVVNDFNNFMRVLEVKMDDGTTESITMSNVGDDPNPEELHKWEWYCTFTGEKKWYRF